MYAVGKCDLQRSHPESRFRYVGKIGTYGNTNMGRGLVSVLSITDATDCNVYEGERNVLCS